MYLLAAFLPILILFPTTIRASCYFPNGGLSSLDVPCDASATESFCCFSAQACLSNKLCYDPASLRYARGTCTDPNWESAACPKFCLDEVALGNPVFSCNTTSSDSYCCNDGCSCSSSSTNKILSFVGTPYIMTVIGSPQIFSDPSSTSTVSPTPTSSSTTATSVTTTASPTSTVSPTPTSSSTTTTSVTATASPTSAVVSSNERTHSSSVAIGVGAGVGVGAGLVLLAAVATFIYQRRRLQLKRAPTGLGVSQKDAGAWAFGQGNAYGPDRGRDAGPVQEMGAGVEARRFELPADRSS